jgi:hypothetical protein
MAWTFSDHAVSSAGGQLLRVPGGLVEQGHGGFCSRAPPQRTWHTPRGVIKGLPYFERVSASAAAGPLETLVARRNSPAEQSFGARRCVGPPETAIVQVNGRILT